MARHSFVEIEDTALVLVYTKRKNRVRVTSMRKASKKERQLYVDKQGKQ